MYIEQYMEVLLEFCTSRLHYSSFSYNLYKGIFHSALIDTSKQVYLRERERPSGILNM
jgi:hypothetical protein